jgi:hypothetical protein
MVASLQTAFQTGTRQVCKHQLSVQAVQYGACFTSHDSRDTRCLRVVQNFCNGWHKIALATILLRKAQIVPWLTVYSIQQISPGHPP